MDYEAMFAKVKAVDDMIKAHNDDLLLALAALSASRSIQIIPMTRPICNEPVIMLPQNMYDRLWELLPTKSKGGD